MGYELVLLTLFSESLVLLNKRKTVNFCVNFFSISVGSISIFFQLGPICIVPEIVKMSIITLLLKGLSHENEGGYCYKSIESSFMRFYLPLQFHDFIKETLP